MMINCLRKRQKHREIKKPTFYAILMTYLVGTLLLQSLFWISPDHEQKIRMAYLWPSVIAVFIGLIWKTAVSRQNFGKAAVGFLIPVWLWITCVLNGDPYLLYNHKFIMGIFLVFGICFPAFLCASPKQVNFGLKLVGYCAVTISTIVACLGIYATYENIQVSSPFFDGIFGIVEGRLWVFLRHPNEVAVTFLATFLFAVYLAVDARHIACKIILGICCIFLFAGIALTVSWTSKLALSVALGLMTALFLMRFLRFGGREVRTMVICVLSIGVFALSILALNKTIHVVSSAAVQNAQVKKIATTAQEAIAHNEDVKDETHHMNTANGDVAMPQERDIIGNFATFSGRTEIWASGLNKIKQQPRILLFGMTDGQAARVPLVLNREIYHMHNTWIEMLLLGGIPGVVLHLWFCVMVVIRCVCLFFAKNVKFSMRVLAIVPIALLIICLMEIYPSFSGTTVDMLFAMIAGAVLSITTAELNSCRTGRECLVWSEM